MTGVQTCALPISVDTKPNPLFKRTLTLESKEPPANLYFRLGGGATLKVEGVTPVQRGTERLVPVTFKDGKAVLTLTYSW